MSNLQNKKTVQIYGPFATSYSLCEVNRQLAYVLEDEYDVSFVDDKKLTDRYPTEEDFKTYPKIRQMMKKKFRADIGVWNRYPHDYVDEIDADFKVLYIAWEASLLPQESIDKFNKNFHAVFAMSEFVKDVLIRSGIKLPVYIVHNAINQEKLNKASVHQYKIPSEKKFKFLNITTGVPRKGLDILLKAYFEEFTSEDDVSLILKTNVFNLDDQIQKLKDIYKEKAPEIVAISEDWSDEYQLNSLYFKSNAYVCSPRCEGFNLPLLEAMYAKIPVIATNYSGHLDFCNPDNSYLVDYKLTDASVIFNIPKALWAEPSVESLREQMRKVYEGQDVEEKVEKAYEMAKSFSWTKVKDQFTNALEIALSTKDLRDKNLGVFSPWNTKCGIGEYSKHFYPLIKSYFKNTYFFSNKNVLKVEIDDEYVSRIWDEGNVDLEALKEKLQEKKIDIFHIQYHDGFYNTQTLVDIAKIGKALCEKVFITLHSIDEINKNSEKKYIKDLVLELNQLDKIFIHNESDIEFLKSLGLTNGVLLPHGITIYHDEDRYLIRKYLNIDSNHIVASHGFLKPDKAYKEIIQAISILKKTYPDIMYLLAGAVQNSDVSSVNYYDECLLEIERLGLKENVVLIDDFLDVDELMTVLHASDVIVMMRKNTYAEGASGAIRFPLTSKRPVITNKARIFRDISDLTTQINEVNPDLIAESIKYIYENPNVYLNKKNRINENIQSTSWESVTNKYIKSI